MKQTFRLAVLACAALATLCHSVNAAPGDVEAGFNPGSDGDVYSTSVQPDGKIVVVGYFTTIAGASRNNMARLNANGMPDTFNPNVIGAVVNASIQTNGQIVLGGNFSSVGGVTRSMIARVNADGMRDAGFDPGAPNSELNATIVQADGKILLSGGFTTVGAASRNRIARLNVNGTLDASFTPAPNNFVQSIALQGDEKMVIGGWFTAVGVETRNRIARLDAGGTLDMGFNPNASADSPVYSVAVQADGKILLGGSFGTVNGQPRSRIARLNADGTLDTEFDPIANDTVWSIAVQADGKIVIGGKFTSVGGTARNRVARLNAAGILDTGFNPNANNWVLSTAIQADGKILLGGNFTNIGGMARDRLARLDNDAATESLTVPSANRVQWLRGGAAPETQRVTFDLSTDGGSLWTPLGAGVRIAGGWELNGLSLPAIGQVRARARTACGQYNGSTGLIETVVAYDVSAIPEISIEQPLGTNHVNGGSVSFGGVAAAANRSLTFIIKNHGFGDLSGLGITVDGPDAAMFIVTATPTAPVGGPGGSTTFTVQFTHASAGLKTATLHISSNDKDENPFDLNLTGNDLSTNANLSSLALSAGALAPAFTAVTTSYTANVSKSTTSVTVTPITEDATATVKVNGVTVPASSASGAISLNIGSNLITTVVTAEDGVTTKTYSATIIRSAFAPGEVDIGFDPNLNYHAYSIAMQSDGRIVIGGNFSEVGGWFQPAIARLHGDGTLDKPFNPSLEISGWEVDCTAVQADGKVIIGGTITKVNFVTRNRLARLNADGTLDMGFNPNLNYIRVKSLAIQPDGKILICGSIPVAGPSESGRVERLDADGTPDTSFAVPGIQEIGNPSEVNAIAIQPDGKIIIGGRFRYVNSVIRRTLARLNADGTLDAGFNAGNANLGTFGYTAVIQPDGKIVVGSNFGVSRLNSDGTSDSSFAQPFFGQTSGNTYSTAVQADGKIIIAGAFITINGVTRNYIARINVDGSLDTAFDANVALGIAAYLIAALQGDGKVVIGGYNFSQVSQYARNNIARLENDTATQVLTAAGPNRIQWLRGGASPAATHVTFELSTNGGNTWNMLGVGTHIAGGWELTGMSLPASGQIRARARTSGGQYNGSSGLVEAITAYTGFLVPEIVLEQPVGADIADGGGSDFGSVGVGRNGNLTFTIKNTGTANLTGLGITLDGANSSDFTVTANPMAPVSSGGGSTTFTVQFALGVFGARTAALHITSNDSDENSFDINLTGSGRPAVPPVVVTSAPTGLSSSSATLIGSVNPKGHATAVWFEYGPTTLYGSATPVQNIPAGTGVVNVLTQVGGLIANSTYHYRILASSSDGSVNGTDVSFVANFPPPTVATGGASALTTTSARVNGSVRAHNADAQVYFDFGTDGVAFPNSIGATPPIVTGDVDTAVSADLTNLAQGVTYYYRVRAVSAGGVGTGSAATLQVAVLSGFLQQSPPVVPVENRQGFIIVSLIPNGIVSGWRFAGEQQWRPSGIPVGGLTTSDRVIEFRPVPGYLTPSAEQVTIVSGGLPTFLTGQYFADGGGGTGAMTITIKPSDVTTPALPVAQRAQWRRLGEDDTQWRDSGTTLPALAAGTYLVEFKELVGEAPDRSTPTPITVNVNDAEVATGSAIYYLAQPPSGAIPAVVPFDTVSTSTNLPYQYVGQLRSDASSGSGFVVKPRVVATAGHMVFDDGSLSDATGLQWLFQRDQGTYEPAPQTPRGWILFTGYAAQRVSENSPGVSSPVSQNMDVAAVYFLEDAGRGGFSGYLASDATTNEWLTSSALKTLVGYPTDLSAGILSANRGRMHATPPVSNAFTPAYAFTYSTTAIRSGGGNSGGPLCVQFEGGAYYPAAIFLGGTGQTVVRAIDSAVIDLFNNAAISAGGGDDQGDGGLTITYSHLTSGNASLTVNLLPASAQWIYAGVTYANHATRSNIVTTPAVISFTDEDGYLTPGAKNIAMTDATHPTPNAVAVTMTYNGITAHPLDRNVTAFGSTTFSVSVQGTPTSYRWKRNGVNLNNGVNANGTAIAGATTRILTLTNVKAADAGDYTVAVTWLNGTVPSDPGTLTVAKAAQAITFGALPNRVFADGAFSVNATASSGLAVSYQIVSGLATIAGANTITPTGFGVVTIRATQGGSADYAAAVPVDRSFQIIGDTLDSWRGRHFTPPELADPLISGPMADPGKDGVNVLLAFALNLDPKANDRATMVPGTGARGLPVASLENISGQPRMVMEYVRRRAAGTPGITYRIEFTSDLANLASWEATGTESPPTLIDETWERVKVTDSQSATPSRCGRLVVTVP